MLLQRKLFVHSAKGNRVPVNACESFSGVGIEEILDCTRIIEKALLGRLVGMGLLLNVLPGFSFYCAGVVTGKMPEIHRGDDYALSSGAGCDGLRG